MQTDMTLVKQNRLPFLKHLYPREVRGPFDWVHKHCLTALGLYPFPKSGIPLANVITFHITTRIAGIAAEYPNVEKTQELFQLVDGRLRQEFAISNKNARRQLRRMIIEHVTQPVSHNIVQFENIDVDEDEFESSNDTRLLFAGMGEELPQPPASVTHMQSTHCKTHCVPKLESFSRDDYFTPPGLCGDLACERLQKSVIANRIAPHSDVPMKLAQRGDVEAAIALALQSQPQVNVYMFDDKLPIAEGNESTTLLVDDLLQRFGSSRIRIWAPNLKQEVIEAHHGTAKMVTKADWLTAGLGCWHAFNDRWAQEIRNAGGLDIVFADCFRGFERGCGALVADLIQRTMFRRRTDAHDGRVCALTFAVSDRYERTLGWSASECALQIVIEIMALFRAPNCPFSCDVLHQKAYGCTMHYFMAHVKERQWVQRVHGFEPVVQHLEKETQSSIM